jgi:hypothetical protein
MHCLLALRARLRGGTGDLRADHLRPRSRLHRFSRHERAVSRVRVRVLRRLHTGMPDRFVDRKERTRRASGGKTCRSFRGDDVRLLRRRLLVQGRNARRRGRAHGAFQGRQGEPRPFLRERAVRLGLRQSQGAYPQTHGAREDQRAVARSVVGQSPASPRSSNASSRNTARAL